MDALAAGDALEALGRVDDLGRVRIALVLLAQVGVLCQGTLERHLGVVGNHLGDAGAHVDRVLEHARGVVDGLLGLHLAVGDDVGDALGTVDVAAVLDDVQPALVIEVHVDIGHLGTLRGQEPLEHQAVLERVERGDVHGVGDDSAGGRTAAGADADAVVLGPLHVLGNDQEVGGKALVADDLVFVLKALFDVDATDLARGPVVTIVLAQALLALAAKLALVRLAGIEQREARQDDGVPVQLHIALVGDLERGGECFGMVGEELRHLFGRFQILLERIAHPIGIVQVAAGIEADQMIVRHGVFGQNEMHVVRADVFDSAFGRQLQQGLIDQ